MGWIKLDDAIADHPKIVAAGPAAAWLYVCGISYSARLLTDGFIPEAQVVRLTTLPKTQALARRLVEVSLWEKVEGGYRVHDYDEWQTDAASVLAKRRADSERKKGGIQKDSKRNPKGVAADSRGRREVEEKRTPPTPPNATAPTASADAVAGGNETTGAGGGNALPAEMCEEAKGRIEAVRAGLAEKLRAS